MSKRLHKLREKWDDIKLSGLKGISDDLEPDVVFDAVVSADPTPNHKYVDWCLNAWSRGTFQWEDIRAGSSSIVADQLLRFETNKHRLPDPAMRSLMKYRGPGELDAAMNNAGVALKPDFFDLSSNQQKKMMMTKARLESIHHETESGLKLDTPLTQFASSILGRQTRWCTAAENDNRFHYYSGNGPLTIIELPDKQRFQMHYMGRETHTLEDFTILDETDNRLNEQQWEKLKPYIPEIVEYTVPRLFKTLVDNSARIAESEKPDILERLSSMVTGNFHKEMEMERSRKDTTPDPHEFKEVDYDCGRHFMETQGIEVLDWDEEKKKLHCIIKEKDLANLTHILNNIPYSKHRNMSNIIIDYSHEIQKEDIYKSYIDSILNNILEVRITIGKNMLINGAHFHDDDFFNITLMTIKMDNDAKENIVTQGDRTTEALLDKAFKKLKEKQKLRLVDMIGHDKEVSKNTLLRKQIEYLFYQKASSLAEMKNRFNQDFKTLKDVKEIVGSINLSNFFEKAINPDLLKDIKEHMKEGVFLEYISNAFSEGISTKNITDKDKEFLIQEALPRPLQSNYMEARLDVILQDAPSQIKEKVIEKFMVTMAYDNDIKIEDIKRIITEKTKDSKAPGVASFKETGLLDFITGIGHKSNSVAYRVLSFLSKDEIQKQTLLAIASSFYKEITPEISGRIEDNPLQIVDEKIVQRMEEIKKMEKSCKILEETGNSLITRSMQKIIDSAKEDVQKRGTLSMKLSRPTPPGDQPIMGMGL